jgi:poly-gamma-glutamate capsule biosynthesis protein CapA/YwtB (metallophosphatase superfamily)
MLNRVAVLVILCVSVLCISSPFLYSIPEQTLKLTFLGDLMAHDVNYRIKDFSVIYKDISSQLKNDDCTFVNLEAPVNEKEPYYTYPSFNMHREYVQAALDAGIDAISLANNHAFDRGLSGITQTLCSIITLKENKGMDLYYSGIRVNPEKDFEPAIIEKKGWKIGFIAVTQFLNTLAKNEYVKIVDYRNAAEADNFIDYVSKVAKEYDLFIISYHGDKEYSLIPDPLKVDFFKKLIKAGCNIVYGNHPHVLQPFEIVDVEGKKGLAIYSLGNFLSGQRWSLNPLDAQNIRSYTGDSIMLKVRVEYKNSVPVVSLEKPIIITNYINEKHEVVIRILENLVNESMDVKWQSYYKTRLNIMSNFISGFPAQLN